MRTIKLISLCAFGLSLFLSAGAPRGGAAGAAMEGDVHGAIAVSVVEGKEWDHAFRVMLVAKMKNQPQMAFWLEDTTGAYVATIYVTHRTATQDWRAGFGEKRERIKRPSSLPVWARAHASGGVEPKSLCGACHSLHKQRKKTIEDPALHAMTGATPKTGFTREWRLPRGIKPGRYTVRAEINHSKDFNEAYPKNTAEGDSNYSGGSSGSGQPSLVWEGALTLGDAPSSVTLETAGHGHPSGASGELFRGLETITTALEIVESIRVEFKPSE
jgi:hypothetical protein